MYCKDRFKDKVMTITGAAGGLGSATAIRAAQEGAKLVLVDVREDAGPALLSKIKDLGAEAIYFSADLSVEENAKKMVEKAIETFGRLDVSINNGGVMGFLKPLHLLSKEDMEYTFKNNFYSTFFCCKHELLQFIAQGGGVIVNIASIAGLVGSPYNPAYASSKYAVNGLTKNLAIDYAKYNIRVNSINPASTSTAMVSKCGEQIQKMIEDAVANGQDPDEFWKSVAGEKQNNLLRRLLTPEEQASSILYMASDEATHLTGSTMPTDGGWCCF